MSPLSHTHLIIFTRLISTWLPVLFFFSWFSWRWRMRMCVCVSVRKDSSCLWCYGSLLAMWNFTVTTNTESLRNSSVLHTPTFVPSEHVAQWRCSEHHMWRSVWGLLLSENNKSEQLICQITGKWNDSVLNEQLWMTRLKGVLSFKVIWTKRSGKPWLVSHGKRRKQTSDPWHSRHRDHLYHDTFTILKGFCMSTVNSGCICIESVALTSGGRCYVRCLLCCSSGLMSTNISYSEGVTAWISDEELLNSVRE